MVPSRTAGMSLPATETATASEREAHDLLRRGVSLRWGARREGSRAIWFRPAREGCHQRHRRVRFDSVWFGSDWFSLVWFSSVRRSHRPRFSARRIPTPSFRSVLASPLPRVPRSTSRCVCRIRARRTPDTTSPRRLSQSVPFHPNIARPRAVPSGPPLALRCERYDPRGRASKRHVAGGDESRRRRQSRHPSFPPTHPPPSHRFRPCLDPRARPILATPACIQSCANELIGDQSGGGRIEAALASPPTPREPRCASPKRLGS